VATMAVVDNTETVVGFIDMDCFYVSVEQNGPFGAEMRGKPAAVVQYNSSDPNTPDCPPEDRSRFGVRTGGIIAVNYAARAKGVTRSMSGKEAIAVCPEVLFVSFVLTL
jgi:DNA polymerase eta